MIKHFLKIFFSSLLLITVILSVTALGYIFLYDKDIVIGKIELTNEESKKLEFYESGTFDYGTTVGKAASNKKRFNILAGCRLLFNPYGNLLLLIPTVTLR